MFSELVDSVVKRSGRKDKLLDIIDYANSTIRECQALAKFHKDLVELTKAADSTGLGYTVWDLPQGFRFLQAVQYPDGTFPDLIQPGKAQGSGFSGQLKDRYYYAASTYLVFQGAEVSPSDASQNIKLAYYQWVPRLKYYASGLRPAVWNDDANGGYGAWVYYDLTGSGDLNYTLAQNQPIALLRVSNWLIFDYNEVIKEGTLAKLFKAIKDETRSVQSYSLYLQLRDNVLMKTEAREGMDNIV